MERKVCHNSMANKLLILCWCTYMVSYIGRFNYASAMAELISTEGFTKGSAGLIGTALFVTYGICQIFSGILGDKLNPRNMITFGLVGSSMVNLLMGLVVDADKMLILWMFNGVFQSCMWSPIARIFAEMLTPSKRIGACSSMAATIPVATIIIYSTAGVSIKYFSWKLIFWLPSVLMIIAAVIWHICMSKIQEHTKQYGEVGVIEIAQQKQSSALWPAFVASGAIFIMVGALSHGLLKDGIQAWVPTFMTEQFNIATSSSAIVAIILPIVNISGVFITRWCLGKFIKNELNGAAGFFLVSIVSLSVLCIFDIKNGLLSIAMLTVASTAMIGANIILINIIPMYFGAIGKASSMTGLLNCTAYIGSAISSFGIGKAAESYGWSFAIGIWITFAIIALIALLIGSKKWLTYRQKL